MARSSKAMWGSKTPTPRWPSICRTTAGARGGLKARRYFDSSCRRYAHRPVGILLRAPGDVNESDGDVTCGFLTVIHKESEGDREMRMGLFVRLAVTTLVGALT